jgi:tetratricopeptide (TPR) repeat protein
MSIVLGVVFALLAGEPQGSRRAQALEHVREGQILLAAESYERAAEAFRSAIQMDDRILLAHYGLGQASMFLRDYAGAVAAFEKARDVFRDLKADEPTKRMAAREARAEQVKLLRERGRALRSRGAGAGRAHVDTQLEPEVQHLERMLETVEYISGSRDDHVPPALSLALGSAHFRDGRPLDAEREYRAAIAADQRLGEAHNNLGVVLLVTGRAREARESLRLASKHGFRVPQELVRDVEAAAAR